MSLKPVAPALEEALGRKVTFVFTDWQDGKAVAAAKAAKPGKCLLDGEHPLPCGRRERTMPRSRKLFASLGDVYVNDAFSAAHRAHSSTEGIAHLVPAYAGRAMEAELKALEAALEKPKRPLVAVVGGAKVSTKLELLGNLSGIANIDRHRRRHGQHLPRRSRLSGRQVALRARPRRDRQGDHRRRRSRRTAPSCCPSMPSSPRNSRPAAASRIVDVTDVAADDMILDAGPKMRCRRSRPRSTRRRRSCGTDRSAPSRSSPSIRATNRGGAPCRAS